MVKSLIAGIDPGTTVGFALFDFNGLLIFSGARKNFGLSPLIKLLSKHGKIEYVACDTSIPQNFILKFSAKVNSKILNPKRDLTLRKKRAIIKNYSDVLYEKIKGKHELAAVASAIFAFKKIRVSERKLSL